MWTHFYLERRSEYDTLAVQKVPTDEARTVAPPQVSSAPRQPSAPQHKAAALQKRPKTARRAPKIPQTLVVASVRDEDMETYANLKSIVKDIQLPVMSNDPLYNVRGAVRFSEEELEWAAQVITLCLKRLPKSSRCMLARLLSSKASVHR
jgi:hypothetical protein